MHTFWQLLNKRRFFPLFVTQLLQAFNDNAFKSAMAILVAYRLSAHGMNPEMKISLAAGLFILPFFLFSASAGQLADKYDKASMTRVIKFFELIFVSLGTIGFMTGNQWLLFTTLFLMGTHSAFFGPIKYAILPEQLSQNELIRANALLEASTFIAILLGSIIGANLILNQTGIYIISALMFAFSLSGWISSFYIPNHGAQAPELKLNFNFLQETWRIISHTRKNRVVFLSILGISWFWLIGAVFMQEFISFAKDTLHAEPGVVVLFQTMFTLGIAIGSLICNRLVDEAITAKYVPLGILLITVCIVDLYITSHNAVISTAHLLTVKEFVLSFTHIHILLDIMGLALFGGVYIVPLYAILQSSSDENYRSRTIAANNIINSLFMVTGSLATTALLAINFTLPEVFLIFGILNALVAAYICKILPEAVVKSFVNWVLKALYKVEVTGLDNYKSAGDRVIIVANHTSLLDIILLSAFLPDKFSIAINTEVAKKWWVRPFLTLVNTYSLDPSNPMSTKSLISLVKNGTKCLIFPEGRLTTTGSLMKVYEGPGMIADKSDAKIVPIRIDGAQYTPFSRLRGKVRIKLFPKITIKILTPEKFVVSEHHPHRRRRQIIASKLYKMMTQMMFESSSTKTTLFNALLDAREIHGSRFTIAEDTQRKPINYRQFFIRTYILGNYIAKQTEIRERVGLMLPTSGAAMIAFFACQAYGRVPAMLNFSSGIHNLLSACKTAKINTIYTSKKFVLTAKLEPLVKQMRDAGYKVVYLESLKNEISLFAKIKGIVTAGFARLSHHYYHEIIRPEDPAVVLFTSGSEGTPKGVLLSHQNILSNCYQMMSRVDFNSKDIMFNALPVFHCFGLTAGGILPIINGIRVFFYPSPLHFRVVPELVYETNATIFFGTDTFLSGYARYAHPYDFYSVRYIFAGAEKLKEQTHKHWTEKFGVRIFEGYGATETSPVLSTNTPMLNKNGSVGCLMPGLQYKLEPVEGIKHGGRLHVAGPNVMLGYIRPDAPDAIDAPPQGWYDTGDIVDIDENGYITIKGRAKRFAKIGGEMVSLTATENYVKTLWPDNQHAVISIPDLKKGEQLVLMTDYKDAKRDELVAFARAHGHNELGIPKKIMVVDEFPILATGKVDYKTAQSKVESEVA